MAFLSTKEPSNFVPRSSSSKIHFIHFNDVYNIESREIEPVGGASRFVTLVKTLRRGEACRIVTSGEISSRSIALDGPTPLVLFSGDAFNPSLMSTLTKGSQMVPILNKIGVDVAVYGNHDFDHGVDVLEDLASKTHFPWLMSNVIDNYTGYQLAGGLKSHTMKVGEYVVGFVGLVEDAWIQTLATVDPEQITYLDIVEEGRRLAQDLRAAGADVVVALTHNRWPNDRRLAESVDEIDIVLGGHDHEYGFDKVMGTRKGKPVEKIVLKSGTDFRELSAVTIDFGENDDQDFQVYKFVVDSSIVEDEETKRIVDSFASDLQVKMKEVLGVMDVELDGRFGQVRTRETNLGNFICDVILAATDADLAILNSGTFRSDVLHPAGPFTRGDLASILPFVDTIVVLSVSGSQILEVLENAVSKWPVLEGRFAQVSGIRFAFDPNKEPGFRVNPRYVEIHGDYLDTEKKDYKLATKAYMAMGKDGYDCLAKATVLVDEETGPILRTLVENYFESIAIVRGVKLQRRSKHRQPLLSRRSASLKSSQPPPSPATGDKRDPVSRARSLACIKRHNLVKQKTIEDLEKELARHSPTTNNRIVVIDAPKWQEYLEDRRTVWEVRNNPTPLQGVKEDEADGGGWGVNGD